MKIFVALFFLFSVFAVCAQPIEKREYIAREKGNSEITIDGRFSEEVWLSAPWQSNFVQYSPYEGEPPYQQTEFAIVYDKNYLYIGVRLLDANPDSISTRMTRRDYAEGDIISINIDSYNDKRTAFGFSVSAAGVKTDVILSDNAAEDNTWDPIWNVKTAVTQKGWNAEIAIPFTQLRFSEGEDQSWGIQLTRYIFRNDEISIWQPMKRDQAAYISNFGILKGISGIKPRKTLAVKPYVVAQLEKFSKDENNPFRTSGTNSAMDAGLDAKIGLTNYLTLDLTLNPDFGQVEADPSQVNLSTYETYYKEKRPFFIEGKNILTYRLDFGDSEWNREALFYSRRIGKTPNYTPILNEGEYIEIPDFTRILGAAKITGKTRDGWSVGVMESLTAKENAEIQSIGSKRTQVVEPLTNYLIGRLQKDFNNGNSYIGGLVTAVNRRIDDLHLNYLHKSAYSGAIDWMHRWNEQKWHMQGGLYFSRVNGSTEAISRTQKSYIRNFQRPGADYLKFDSTRTSLSGYGGKFALNKIKGRFRYGMSLTWKSPGLEINDVGYSQLVDRITESLWSNYQIYNPFFIFRYLSFNASEYAIWDFGGNLNLLGFSFSGNAQFKNFWNLSVTANHNGNQRFSTSLRGGPALKSPATFEPNISLSTNPQKKLTFNLSGSGILSYEKDFNKNRGASFNIGYRPINPLRFDITPGVYFSDSELQYVTQTNYNGGKRYIFARIDQKTINISFRINYSITPDFSIQYWGQPFIATGKYSDYKYITNSLADETADRYSFYTSDQISFNDAWNSYAIDDNQDGSDDYYFAKPDFNVKTFLSNLVLRWEYLPGSIVYLVWSQNRNGYSNNGALKFKQDISNLIDLRSDHVFLVKLSYRLGR